MLAARRPLIGLTIGPEREAADNLSLRSTYTRAIELVGGAPVLVPPVDGEALGVIADRLDGLVLPGGVDVDPSLYGAPRHPKTKVNHDLDRHELAMARWAVYSDVPVLGICRGHQLINVVLGGSLIQHLEGHTQRLFRSAHSHGLRVDRESRLAEMLGTSELSVNSFHHQAVERLGAGLRAVAWAPDGTIEGLESVEHPWLVTVQFHPEDLANTRVPSRRLLEAFVQACQRRLEGHMEPMAAATNSI